MLVIADLDDTLIEGYVQPRQPFARVAVMQGRVELLARLRAEGHTIGLATNQGGVAFGYSSEAEVEAKLACALVALGLPSDTFVAVCYADPRSPNPRYQTGHERRKPSGAMLREAMVAHPAAAAAGVVYVGDRNEDAAAAADAGVPFAWADAFFHEEV